MATLFAAGVPFRRTLIAAVLAPYAVSEVIAVIIWKYMFEPEVGIVSQALAAAGIPELAWTTDRWPAWRWCRADRVWLHLPFTFLILYAARLAVPDELYESRARRRRHGWQRSGGSPSPVLIPAILVALMFRYIFAFRIFAEVWLLTGGGPARLTEVLAIYLYRQAFRYHEFGVASATGWLMVLLSLLIALRLPAADVPAMLRRPMRRPLPARILRAMLGIALVAAVVGLPDPAGRPVLAQAAARHLRLPAALSCSCRPSRTTRACGSLARASSERAQQPHHHGRRHAAHARRRRCSPGFVYARYRSRALAGSAFFLIFMRMLPPIVSPCRCSRSSTGCASTTPTCC